MDRIILIVLTVLLSAACSSTNVSSSFTCEPGTMKACTCKDGNSGIQHCSRAPSVWLDCICNADGDMDIDLENDSEFIESETEETEVDGDSEVTEDSDSEESEESETEEVDSNEESESEESEEAETEELPNPALQGSCPEGQACFLTTGAVNHLCVTGTWTVSTQYPCTKTSDCPNEMACTKLDAWETGYCVSLCQPSAETECVPTFGPHSVNSCCGSNGSWRPVDYEVSPRRDCVKNYCGENHDGKAEVPDLAGTSCNSGTGTCDGKGKCCGNWGCD